jgi:protein SCO1/2
MRLNERQSSCAKRLAHALAFAIVAAAALLAGALPALAAGSASSRAAGGIGGAFTLVDQDGRTVTDESYRGKWLLVYFGYTHCPDTCPMALGNMAAAFDRLDARLRARLQAIFVTVDPQRDTPAVLKDYVEAFEGANIVGLSGTQAQVAALESAYRVHAQRRDEADGEYSIDHTSFIHIVDPAGRFVGLISDLMPPERLANRLTQLLK